MKILHLLGIGKLPRKPELIATGGTTRVVLEVAARQSAQGHEVSIAAVARESWTVEWRRVRLVSLALRPWAQLRVGGAKLDLTSQLPLLGFTAGRRLDVIHSHEFNDLRYLPARVRVTHFHNDPCRFPQGHETAMWEARECLAAARYSHAHVAVSHFVAAQLLKRYADIQSWLPPRFDAAARTHVVHNGVDLQHFDPSRHAASRERVRSLWGFGRDEFVFAFSGATVREKGVGVLVEAFRNLAVAQPRARLVLAGHSRLWEDSGSRAGVNREHLEFEKALEASLESLERDGKARRLGLVPPEQMPAIYAAADAVVVPSLVQEACPLAALEGLAMGKPLIASEVGGVVEFATADNSVLVTAGQEDALRRAMERVIQHGVLTPGQAAAVRTSVSSLTWERAVERLSTLYTELLANSDHIVRAKPPAFYRM